MTVDGQPRPPVLRVMYVEDDRVSALLFREALRAEPAVELRLAEDGAQALALAAGWTPQVLVLDAHLPDTNGHALLARLRGLPGLAATPAFMCSADGEPDDLERARVAGFAGFWTKPFMAATVLATLMQLVRPRS